MSIKRAIAVRLLPRYAQGTLPAPLRDLVREVIDDDADLAARYHLLRRLEQAARVDDDAVHGGVSPAQEDLIFAGLQSALDRQPTPAASGLRLPVLSGALAAAAAVTFIVVAPGPRDSDALLQARGDAVSPLGVRVRCVDDHGSRVLDDATAGARQGVSSLACPDDGLLAFSLTNLGAEARSVFVVGVDEAGAVVFLPPFSASADAVKVAPGSVDVVLDRLAPMPVVDGDGLTLHVLVDDAPFSGASVKSRLEMATVAALPLSSLGRLPVDVDLQFRLNLYRRP